MENYNSQTDYQQLLSRVTELERRQRTDTHNGIDAPLVNKSANGIDESSSGSGSDTATLLVTRDLSNSAGTVATAHGLGRIPTFVRATAYFVAGTGHPMSSFGTYNGSYRCVYFSINGATVQANQDSGALVILAPNGGGSNYQIATVTLDSANISLTWTKSGTPTGNAFIILEAN